MYIKSTFPYPIEKVKYFPYLYLYPVNVEILSQNGDEFEQYPQERVYLLSLLKDGVSYVKSKYEIQF